MSTTGPVHASQQMTDSYTVRRGSGEYSQSLLHGRVKKACPEREHLIGEMSGAPGGNRTDRQKSTPAEGAAEGRPLDGLSGRAEAQDKGEHGCSGRNRRQGSDDELRDAVGARSPKLDHTDHAECSLTFYGVRLQKVSPLFWGE